MMGTGIGKLTDGSNELSIDELKGSSESPKGQNGQWSKSMLIMPSTSIFQACKIPK